jgi:hypothetical protein
MIMKNFVGKCMKIFEIKEKAKVLGIKPGNMKKTELIHAIQTAEGNTPCFGRSSNGSCPHTNCCFMDECLTVKCGCS